MTYTGRPRIAFACDLPAAVHPSVDIWYRTDTGDEATVTAATVTAATRTGDTVAITVEFCNWPRPNTTDTFTVPADSRISTRVY